MSAFASDEPADVVCIEERAALEGPLPRTQMEQIIDELDTIIAAMDRIVEAWM